jgi:glycosyltransferase involved in cell wall biosynthesis
MRIYLDGMWFRHTGIGRIYDNLLQGLVEAEEVESISTVVQLGKKRDFEERFRSPKIEAKFVDYPFNYREMLSKGKTIRAFETRPDIYYFPSFNVPFFLGGRIIGTVCDLIPLTTVFGLPWHVKARFRIAIRHAIRSSLKIVCISEFTKRHVMEEFGVAQDHIEVIYPPLRLPDEDEIEEVKRQPPLVDGDYLLYVGNRHVHKNVPCMIEALRILKTGVPGLRAVVAGTRMRRDDDVDAVLKNPEMRAMVIEFPEASDEEIRNLHAHARVFVFPTRIEGFGIPPLEALSFGVPVVGSDIPVIREVCGNTIRYANPDNPGDFARTIRETLAETRDDEVIRRGKERARRYARNNSVAQYLDLFRRSLEGKI